MKRIFAALLAGLLFVGLLAGCNTAKPDNKAGTPELDAIKKRGVLNAGVKIDVPKFGYKDPSTGTIDGFEVDLARAIAKQILGDPSKVNLVPINAKTRGPALDNGEVDVVVATFTVTDARKHSWNFSTPYYQDNVRLLVKANGPKSFKDLNGQTVAVAQGSTTRQALQDAAKQAGITLNFSEFATYPEAKAALDAGRVAAFSTDGSILMGYLDANTALLPEKYSPQQYAVATKLTNKALAQTVDGVVTQMQKSGDLNTLLTKWGLK